MIRYAKENPGREFIIGTEVGMKQRLEAMFPESKFFMASRALICPNMKKTYPEYLFNSIKREETLVTVDPEMAAKARRAIERMHEF
jgi:quinolinate synthase